MCGFVIICEISRTPGYDVVYNLPLPIEPLAPLKSLKTTDAAGKEYKHGTINGRAWTDDCTPMPNNLPYAPANPMPALDYSKLACIQQSYLLTRCDCNKQACLSVLVNGRLSLKFPRCRPNMISKLF